MAKVMLLGLLMLLAWSPGAMAGDYDYNAYQCEAFAHNLDKPFDVPVQGQFRVTIDMRHCGGFVQNYQVTLMNTKRGEPYATLMVLDQYGRSVGVSDAGHHLVQIGRVPIDAVYTVVVTSGSRRAESCTLFYSGGI